GNFVPLRGRANHFDEACIPMLDCGIAPAALRGNGTQMRSFSIGAGIAALSIFASAGAALAANGPAAHILVIDRQAIITGSKLGQNIRQQIMALEEKAQSELGPEGQKLQNEVQAAGNKKNQALEAKQSAFQQKVRDRQSLIQGGQIAAR